MFARLAVVHIIYEGNTLKLMPETARKFSFANDFGSAVRILEKSIFPEDDKVHVESGKRWFLHLCEKAGMDTMDGEEREAIQLFREVTNCYFKTDWWRSFDNGSNDSWIESFVK